ncbi:MAG: PH domain-containing protein [Solirubrobacterales bacterium]
MIDPVRNHFSSVILNIVRSMKTFFFVFVAIIVKPEFSDLFLIGIILFIMFVLSIIKWYKTCFYIKEDTLIYETGVFEKKILKLSIDKISTIDFSQNLVNMLFGTFRLKIDSGSITAGSAEIDIVLKKNIAVNIRNSLLGADRDEAFKEYGRRFCITNLELLITAITKNNLFIGIGLFFSMFNFFDDLLKGLNIEFSGVLERFINPEKIISSSISAIIIFLIEAFIVVWVICIIFSVIATVIKFYNFRVYKSNNNIKIKYGLINTKSYSLPIKNIHAVVLKQNFLQQKLGLYNIEISSVGYGNEANEEAVLYPIAGKKLMEEMIKEFLPEFEIQPKLQNAGINTLVNFITVPTITGIFICIAATAFFGKAAVLFIIIPFITASAYLNYKHSALGYNEETFVSSSGGFNRKIHMVKMKSVQSAAIHTNPFQRKKGIGNYLIHYYSSKLGEVIKIKNISDSFFNEINSIILK